MRAAKSILALAPITEPNEYLPTAEDALSRAMPEETEVKDDANG